MNKHRAMIAVSIVGVLALTGCGDANSKDLKGIGWKTPEKIEVYANIDQHPNIVRLCIGKVAFATTSRNAGMNLMRVPEWDVTFCGGVVSLYMPQTMAADPAPTKK